MRIRVKDVLELLAPGASEKEILEDILIWNLKTSRHPCICGGPGEPCGAQGAVRFIIDAQLPPALAHLSRKSGFDAAAVREIGLRDADDEEIWRYALQYDAGVITKDEDFTERSLRSSNQR